MRIKIPTNMKNDAECIVQIVVYLIHQTDFLVEYRLRDKPGKDLVFKDRDGEVAVIINIKLVGDEWDGETVHEYEFDIEDTHFEFVAGLEAADRQAELCEMSKSLAKRLLEALKKLQREVPAPTVP